MRLYGYFHTKSKSPRSLLKDVTTILKIKVRNLLPFSAIKVDTFSRDSVTATKSAKKCDTRSRHRYCDDRHPAQV